MLDLSPVTIALLHYKYTYVASDHSWTVIGVKSYRMLPVLLTISALRGVGPAQWDSTQVETFMEGTCGSREYV